MSLDKHNGSGKRFVIRSSFSKAIAAGVEGPFTLRRLGTGMAVSQTGGNLVITSGTTANQETIIRLDQAVLSDMVLKYALNMSQRIANNNVFIELVDYVAEAAVFTINSTTSVTVRVNGEQGNRFDAGSIGQTIALGNITGAAGIPMRGTIAAVAYSGKDVLLTFTVAGWPASGIGTLDLFGHNTLRILYDSTVVTNLKFDTIRNGYGSGDTTATINTTASPGHSVVLQNEDSFVALMDRLVASALVPTLAQRASRVAQIPDSGAELFLQIRVLNGTTNPASTTTTTVTFIGIEDYNPAVVSVQSIRAQGADGVMPVSLVGTSPVTSTPAAAPTVVIGQTAHTVSATLANGPTLTITRVASVANTTGILARTGVARLVGGTLFNASAATKYVKLYNKATAPTVGTDTPIMTIPVAPSGRVDLASVVSQFGLNISLGLGFGITGAVADSDTTAPAANDVIGALIYV